VKYKGEVEVSKEEIDCLFGWIERLITLENRLSKKRALAHAKNVLSAQEKTHEDEDEELEDEDDSLEWEDDEEGDSEEDIKEVHEPVAIKEYKKEDPELLKGKEVARKLFTMWLENFDEEGEQPPRADTLKDLARNTDGRRLYKYMKDVFDKGGDTTTAIRDLVPNSVSDDVVRHVAENFTQVTSILFTQLSDFLRYPNPLDQEE
jgi:hypothetical protein